MKKFLNGMWACVQNNGLILVLLLLGGGYFLYSGESVNHFSESASYMSADHEIGGIAFAAKSESLNSRVIPPPNDVRVSHNEDRKIVKNASLQIEVEDTEESVTIVEEEVANLKGQITHQNSWETRPGVLSYNFTVRIPQDSLDILMDNIAQLGIKKNESYSTQDITSQYEDTENQIKNLEIRRDRLRELMQKESEDLSDVLSIDQELSKVQNQIENFTRLQKRRDDQVTYSTLNLSLTPYPQIGDFNNPHWDLKRSWKNSLNDFVVSLQKIVDGALKVLIYTPIWLTILILFFVIRSFLRKKK